MWEKDDISDYYELVPNPSNAEEGVVKITTGPFVGLLYKYGDFKFKRAENEDDPPSVEYHFEVIDIPEEIRDVQYPDDMKESFDQLLVGILMDIVQKDAKKDVRVDYDSTDGEGDLDESFERRVFYKIDSSVPQG